jgi:hypothetical protein
MFAIGSEKNGRFDAMIDAPSGHHMGSSVQLLRLGGAANEGTLAVLVGTDQDTGTGQMRLSCVVWDSATNACPAFAAATASLSVPRTGIRDLSCTPGVPHPLLGGERSRMVLCYFPRCGFWRLDATTPTTPRWTPELRVAFAKAGSSSDSCLINPEDTPGAVELAASFGPRGDGELFRLFRLPDSPVPTFFVVRYTFDVSVAYFVRVGCTGPLHDYTGGLAFWLGLRFRVQRDSAVAGSSLALLTDSETGELAIFGFDGRRGLGPVTVWPASQSAAVPAAQMLYHDPLGARRALVASGDGLLHEQCESLVWRASSTLH